MGELPVSPVRRATRAHAFSRRTVTGARRAVKAVAIEKGLAAYFTLACGHLTTREDQLSSVAWRPARGKYWCEKCAKWMKIFPKPTPEPLPDEPMF